LLLPVTANVGISSKLAVAVTICAGMMNFKVSSVNTLSRRVTDDGSILHVLKRYPASGRLALTVTSSPSANSPAPVPLVTSTAYSVADHFASSVKSSL